MHRTYYHICNRRRRERNYTKLALKLGTIDREFRGQDRKIDTEKETEKSYSSSFYPCNVDEGGCFLWPKPRIYKLLLNARLCRLTETARLLKNVKSVFTRRSNAASRVNVEVELSRKLSFPQTLTYAGEILRYLILLIYPSRSYSSL